MLEVHLNAGFRKVGEAQDVVALELLGNHSCQNRLVIGDEICSGPFLLGLFLKLVEDLEQSCNVVVLDLRERNIQEAKGIQGPVGVLVDQLELDGQDILLELGLSIVGDWLIICQRELSGLFLMQDGVFEVRLGKSCVDLVNLGDFYKLRDHTMLRQLDLPLLSQNILLGLIGRSGTGSVANLWVLSDILIVGFLGTLIVWTIILLVD